MTLKVKARPQPSLEILSASLTSFPTILCPHNPIFSALATVTSWLLLWQLSSLQPQGVSTLSVPSSWKVPPPGLYTTLFLQVSAETAKLHTSAPSTHAPQWVSTPFPTSSPLDILFTHLCLCVPSSTIKIQILCAKGTTKKVENNPQNRRKYVQTRYLIKV